MPSSGRRPYSLLAGLSLLFIGFFASTTYPVKPAFPADPFVMVAAYDGVINPVAAEYLHDALASAEAGGSQALVIALNTPGGLDSSMRLIIKDITGATVPVIVYVSPSSGRAASAGVFTLATSFMASP